MRSPTRIPLAVKWGDVMKAKDETASSYVMLEDIAKHFGVQTATVRKRAADLGANVAKIRNVDAKNAYCAAVTVADALRIRETFRTSKLITGAHVLTPDEIKNLMEEK
jgi:hypothetical protein